MSAKGLLYRSLIGAAIALTLATLLVTARYRLELTRDLVREHEVLETLGSELAAELDRGAQLAFDPQAAGPVKGWHAWEFGPAGYRDGAGNVPPIAESALRRALAERRLTGPGALALLGPFATTASGNALALARPVRFAGGVTGWAGSWEPIGEVFARAQLTAVLKQGLRLQLYDAGNSTALYQSDDARFVSETAVPVRLGGSLLELRGARRERTAVPLRALSSSLLVLIAVALWAGQELRRDRTLRSAAQALEESEARRREASGLYGSALDTLASLESRLHMVSTFDSVTGLANRSSLLQRIEATLDSMRQSRQGALVVMAIGFDHLQQIADSFGADFASRVLVVAAERLEFVLTSKESLFRTGDSQLAVVLTNNDAARSEELARQMVAEVEAPIGLDSHTFVLRPSVGIADTTSGYEYAEALLDRANAALAAVSRDAPTRWCRFDSAATRESISRLQLEADLDRAFERNELLLEYEPFVVPRTHSVVGFEALIRWNHPTEGRLLPGRFVPVALQAGLANRLNDWLIRAVTRQAALWRRAGHEDFFINFNLSAEAMTSARRSPSTICPASSWSSN
jgi:diguanylate cyclase (GGDEF)-like protein